MGFTGFHHTKEAKRRIRKAQLGNRHQLGKKQSEELKTKRGLYNLGSEHHCWKGAEVGYDGLHHWLKRMRGVATKCENPDCIYPRKNTRGKIMLRPKRYNWANKSHEYKRDLNDWVQLCVSCHKSYDMGRLNLAD